MVIKYFDPVFSRTYIRQEDGRYFCEGVDLWVTEDQANQEGFKPIWIEGTFNPADVTYRERVDKAKAELKEIRAKKIEAVVDAVEYMIRQFTGDNSNVFRYAIRDARTGLRKALENL